MGLPYFPLFPTDFEADTSHLTLAEDGAYNRLLRLCWMTPGCSLPDDEAWIMRRMRARTDDEIEAVRAVLAEFFTVKNGRCSNARLTREYHAAHEAHERRKNAGAKGGKAKALKTNETTPSNAVAKPKQPEPEPEPLKREAKASPKSQGTRLPDDWTLPMTWGEWALSEQWPDPVIRAEADKFRDYWHSVAGQKGRKADWFATWRNWMRNSKAPKMITGDNNGKPASKSQDRLSAFIAGARGTS